jgi:hypothetical protein
VNLKEQKQKLLEKLGANSGVKIGYSERTLSMNINRKDNNKKINNKGCNNCSRKSGQTSGSS